MICAYCSSPHIYVFVEFQSWHEASQARGALHGQCIYDGCCLLDIQHTPPSISVHRLPNAEPVVVDWDRVEVEPLASSSTPSATTLATPFTVITSTTISEVFPEVHKATIDPIIDKALNCEVLLVLPASHNTSALTTTNAEDAREGDDIFPAAVGCIIMAPTSCSTLCLHDNGDKNITTQVPACAPIACPHPSPDRRLGDTGVLRPLPWPSFLRDGDDERPTSSCPTTKVSGGLFRKAAAHSCKADHMDSSYCQYEVRHDTSFITPFLPACVVFSMVNQLWHSRCSFSIAPAPWKSWRRYWSGALLGFQTNESMQALDDARRGTCVELRLSVGYWPSCYGTGVQLNQQTTERRHLNNEQLVEVTLWDNNLDMVELAYYSSRLQIFIAMFLTRMIWSLAWLSNYHGEFVHTDRRMIKASKYKMEEQQKLGGIGLHSCSPHSVWLPNNIFMAALENGSHSWKEEQGKCTHLCKFGGVHLSSSASVHLGVGQRLDDFVKSGCVDAVTHQLGVQCCLAIDQTWDINGAENVRALYKKHNGEDTVLVLGHEQHTTVFVVIPKLVLALQGLQRLDRLTILTPQGMYWVALTHVVTCVEVLDAHAQWDPGGFWSTICGDKKTNPLERSQRLQRIGSQGYTLIIGMNASPAPWDPDIVEIYESAVPVRVKARRTPCRSGSFKLLQPAHAIAWGQAMFCRGGSVTTVLLPGPHLGDGLLTWGRPNTWSLGYGRIKETGGQLERDIEELNHLQASLPLLLFPSSCYCIFSSCLLIPHL